jgi:hypothetical protein
MIKQMLFGDRTHSHAIVTQQNIPRLGICSTTFDQFTLYLSNLSFPFLHDLRKRSYLLNPLSERGGNFTKRKEMKSLVGMVIM